jgi:hypothetical protein
MCSSNLLSYVFGSEGLAYALLLAVERICGENNNVDIRLVEFLCLLRTLP